MENVVNKKVQTGALIIYFVISIVIFFSLIFFEDKISTFWTGNLTISTGLLLRMFSKPELKNKKKIFTSLVIYFFIAVGMSIPFFVYKANIEHSYLYVFLINLILASIYIYATFFKSK